MSLDVYLYSHSPESQPKENTGIFIRENGSRREISRQEWDEKFPGQEPFVADLASDGCVFDYNITHNLGKMAGACGVYKVLWRADENGIVKASQLIEPLTQGIKKLKENPNEFKQYNPENGWGNYEGLLVFLEQYLKACKQYPDARVSISR